MSIRNDLIGSLGRILGYSNDQKPKLIFYLFCPVKMQGLKNSFLWTVTSEAIYIVLKLKILLLFTSYITIESVASADLSRELFRFINVRGRNSFVAADKFLI